MGLRITTEAAGLLMVALAIFAHAWVSKVGPSKVTNIVGWVVVGVTSLVFGSHFIHC